MDMAEAIEALERPLRSQDKELQTKFVGLQWEIKKMLIMKTNPKTSPRIVEKNGVGATHTLWFKSMPK